MAGQNLAQNLTKCCEKKRLDPGKILETQKKVWLRERTAATSRDQKTCILAYFLGPLFVTNFAPICAHARPLKT